MRRHEREQRVVEHGGVRPVHGVAGVGNDDETRAGDCAFERAGNHTERGLVTPTAKVAQAA